MSKFLDDTGLTHFWEKIKANFFRYSQDSEQALDMDDIRTPGIYTGNFVASSCPFKRGDSPEEYHLIVTRHTFIDRIDIISQIAIYNKFPKVILIYNRHSYADIQEGALVFAWGSWDRITTQNDLDNLAAEDIPYYSTGTDSVKDVLDDNSGRIDVLEYNSSSGGVNMATYTDSNPYIAPTDGYVMASSEGSSRGQIRVPIRFANGTQGPYIYMNVTGSYQIQSVFVKKGMRIGILANTTSGLVRFYPLDSYT